MLSKGSVSGSFSSAIRVFFLGLIELLEIVVGHLDIEKVVLIALLP